MRGPELIRVITLLSALWLGVAMAYVSGCVIAFAGTAEDFRVDLIVFSSGGSQVNAKLDFLDP